jgi:hypothetical protein
MTDMAFTLLFFLSFSSQCFSVSGVCVSVSCSFHLVIHSQSCSILCSKLLNHIRPLALRQKLHNGQYLAVILLASEITHRFLIHLSLVLTSFSIYYSWFFLFINSLILSQPIWLNCSHITLCNSLLIHSIQYFHFSHLQSCSLTIVFRFILIH